MVTGHFPRSLQGFRTAHIHTDRRIEFQSPAACGRLGITEHNAQFFSELIDKNYNTIRFADYTCELTQRLRHQAGMKPHMGLSHLPVDLRLGHQRRHRVHDDDIHRAGTDHRFRNLQSLFAVIRLGYVQIIDIYAYIFRVSRIKGMLGVNKAGNPSPLLYLRHHMKGHRRLTAGLRSINLHDTSPGNPPQTQSNIKTQRAGRYRLHIHIGHGISQLHN